MLAYFPGMPSAVLIQRTGEKENNLHGPKRIQVEDPKQAFQIEDNPHIRY